MLLGAKGAGGLSRWIGLPAVFGELLAGLLIGPAILGLVALDASLSDLAELGVLVLMFLAGLETDLPQLQSVGKEATLVAVGGVVLPMGAGLALGEVMGLTLAESLFAGAVLTATSVSISAQVLWQLGRLNSREGQTILAAAIIDDVLGVIVLTLVIAGTRGSEVILPLAKMGLFFLGALLVGQYLLPDLARRIHRNVSADTKVAVALALALGNSWLASELGGVAAITGAYIAGVFVARTHLRGQTLRSVTNLGFGFLIPLFFVSVGMAVQPQDLALAPLFTALLTLVAVFTKVVGCLAGARVGGMEWKPAWRVGVGMVARGEVALVIAAVGLKDGFIDPTLYSASVVMTLGTTLITPILLHLSYGGGQPQAEADRGPLGAMLSEGPGP